MMSVVGLNARSLDTRTGIGHIWTFWQLTCQSLLMRLTPWRRTTGSTHRVQVQATLLHKVSKDYV
jgi:hypothetical protein